MPSGGARFLTSVFFCKFIYYISFILFYNYYSLQHVVVIILYCESHEYSSS